MQIYKETKATAPLAHENAIKDIKAYWLPIAEWIGVKATQKMDYGKLEKKGKKAFVENLEIPEEEINMAFWKAERKFCK